MAIRHALMSAILLMTGIASFSSAAAHTCDAQWERLQLEQEKATDRYRDCKRDQVFAKYSEYANEFQKSCDSLHQTLLQGRSEARGFGDDLNAQDSALKALSRVHLDDADGLNDGIRAVHAAGKGLHTVLAAIELPESEESDGTASDSSSTGASLEHDLCQAILEWKKAELFRKRLVQCPTPATPDSEEDPSVDTPNGDALVPAKTSNATHATGSHVTRSPE